MNRKSSAVAQTAQLGRPLGDRVLIKRDEAEVMAGGGLIHVPEQAKEVPSQGTVVAVGKGKVLESGTRLAPDVEVGDRVLFGKYAGAQSKIGGEDYLIIREEEILYVLPDAK
jgi:chaperonin GroES